MTTISISLPSIYPAALERTLKNLRDATRVKTEIIVVSPQAPPAGYPNVVWIQEDPKQANGCNAGHARAFSHMTGEFVMAWVDDHLICDGWDTCAMYEYEEREALFHKTGAGGKPFVLGLRHIAPSHVGTQFGIYYAYFPLTRRKYIEEVGWYDPVYKKGFADGDLSLRIWTAGGRGEWSSRGLISAHQDDYRKQGVMYDPNDMVVFVQRWAPLYGKGWDTSTLRGFNIDVVPEVHPRLVNNRSIFYNKPEYRQIALEGGWRP